MVRYNKPELWSQVKPFSKMPTLHQFVRLAPYPLVSDFDNWVKILTFQEISILLFQTACCMMRFFRSTCTCCSPQQEMTMTDFTVVSSVLLLAYEQLRMEGCFPSCVLAEACALLIPLLSAFSLPLSTSLCFTAHPRPMQISVLQDLIILCNDTFSLYLCIHFFTQTLLEMTMGKFL